MKEYIDKLINWAKDNKVIAIIIGIAAVLLFFPKLIKKVLPGTRRVRRRRHVIRRTATRRTRTRRTRRTATKRTRRTGTKKAWQVKGSIAAKRRMARLRRLRRK